MRFFKVALLIQYFEISKNKKKALLFINIGIFLSIFALSSAFISINIENKINAFEYEHADLSYQKKYYQQYHALLPEISGELNQLKIMENENEYFSMFIKLNPFGNRLVSREDMYLPIILNLESDRVDLLKLMEEFTVDMDELKLDLEAWFVAEDAKRYLDMFTNFKEKFSFSVSPEELKDYTNIVYESDHNILIQETIKLDSLNIDSGKFFDQSNKAQDQIKAFEELMYFLNHLYTVLLFDMEKQINEINNKITLYSSYESKIIIVAFLLQLIVFIIIQFFEVSSINLVRSIKRKKSR
ncbi:hypothetical protein OAR49_01740 [Pelagibacteraceae bacterium]|nr:hypothetical protein [Pelagibacteraceae bacterium]